MANHYYATMRNLSTGGSKFALCLAIVFSGALNLAAQSRFDQSDARERSMVPLSDSFSSGSSWQGSSWLNNGLRQTPDWRLGVTVTNQENGVVVRNVTPNSAGARARLEPNDLIITVGGYQVGMIDGRLFDLGDELKRRADASGVVSMLVQDHNNGVISNVRVQLDASTSTLTGELIYRERLPIPSDAVITVLVEDVTRPFAAIRGGQVSYRPNGANTIPLRSPMIRTISSRRYLSGACVCHVSARSNDLRIGAIATRTDSRQSIDGSIKPRPRRNAIAGTGGGSVVTAGYPNFNLIDDEIIAIYRKYLNRSPTSGEFGCAACES